MSAARAQRGFLLIAAIVLIVVLSFFALVISFLFVGGNLAGANHLSSAKAVFVVESGLERATRFLLAPGLAPARIACTAIPGGNTQVNAASGEFALTVQGASPYYSNPPPTLSAAVLVGTNAIPFLPVSGIANLAPYGRVMVDRELLEYESTGANAAACGGGASPCLRNVARARDGTAGAAHAVGTGIGQYQCSLASLAGAPSIGSPDARRTMNAGIQLQEGWIVGVQSAVTPAGWLFSRWNAPPANLNSWTPSAANTPLTNAVQLNSVSMLSYADGWAVGTNFGAGGGIVAGQRWTFFRWNGAAWNRILATSTAPIAAVALNSVFMNSATDGWAVGTNFVAVLGVPAPGLLWTFFRWNGAAWTRIAATSTAPVAAVALNSVFMNSATDGWAVGTNFAAGPGVPTADLRWTFFRWNGVAWTRIPATSTGAAIVAVPLNSVFMNSATDGWAVGNNLVGGPVAGLRWTFFRWNGAAWTRFPAISTAPTAAVALNSVFMNSATDGWAVGDTVAGGAATQRWTFFRWDGAAWTRFLLTTPGVNASNLRSVYCITANDCWAVGDALGGNEIILHWDGTTWTRIGPSATVPNVDLRSVNMLGARTRPRAAWREAFP